MVVAFILWVVCFKGKNIVTIIRVGSNKKFADGWGSAFGKKKKKSTKTAIKTTAAKKKKAKKKKWRLILTQFKGGISREASSSLLQCLKLWTQGRQFDVQNS